MSENLEAFLDRVPDPAEVRRRIAENLKERQLLRRVLKLAEERAACNPKPTSAVLNDEARR